MPFRRQPAHSTTAVNFLLLKYIHILCVAASFALFFIRGIWVMQSYPPAQERWVKVLPHIVDGLLIVSALGMLYMAPATTDYKEWMTVKLVLIGVYAFLVFFVGRMAKNRLQRFAAWLAALLVFLFITSIAVLHNPKGIVALF